MGDLNKTFLEAYNAHADALFRFCFFKLSDKELARDFVQDTFTKAWSNLASEKSANGGTYHGGKDIENMRAFLYRIAGNLIIDEYRRRGSRKPQASLDDLHELGFDPGEDETGSWVDKIDGEEAIKLIAKVPEPYGEAVFMRYVQGLTLEEISEITGESENTISVRIHRGLIRLRKLFNHDGSAVEENSVKKSGANNARKKFK